MTAVPTVTIPVTIPESALADELIAAVTSSYRDAADAERLFEYCALQAGHQDFFIRKAIGWALREYAYTAPEAVRTFLDRERDRLSPLSVREAAKHL